MVLLCSNVEQLQTLKKISFFFFLYSVGMGHPFETPVITHLAKKFECIVMVEHHFLHTHACALSCILFILQFIEQTFKLDM